MFNFRKIVTPLTQIAQRLSVVLISGLALGLLAVTIAATFGYLPWLSISAQFGDFTLPHMGMYLQIFFTLLCATLVFFLPSHGRMMRLENSHRRFQMSMEDVAHAYRLAHEADREKLFKTGSEFDAVRERIAHLRDHPDLTRLEPDVLEAAAQMSFESRELASIYSTEKVERARTFLRQRHQEMEHFQENLTLARNAVDDLKHWLMQVEADEHVVSKQVDALEADLVALLPKLGFDIHGSPSPERTVVSMNVPSRKSSRDRKATNAKSHVDAQQDMHAD